MGKTVTSFAPQLYIPHGITDVSFYEKALGAKEIRRFSNDDGTIHVVEFDLDGNIFHLHESSEKSGFVSPGNVEFKTAIIGLFVSDVDALMLSAEKAGAKIKAPAQSFDYGYRQGEFLDPFGHCWMIQKPI